MALVRSLLSRSTLRKSAQVGSSARFYVTGSKGPVNPLQVAFQRDDEDEEKRYRTEKNPEIPNVSMLQKRWNTMDAGKQDDIIAYLEDRMRGDWKELTPDEKKALHYIYFGPWGPRAEDAGDQGSLYGTFAWIMAGALVAVTGYKLSRAYLGGETEPKSDQTE